MFLAFPSLAQADLYLRPRAGATFPIRGGDAAYSLGVAAGYEWTDFFATEISYSRLIGTGGSPDGDAIRGEGIVSFPLPVVTPFASAGAGMIHTPGDWNSMILVGGGVTLDPILFLQLGAGVSYAAVWSGPDFVEPYVLVGIAF